MSERRKETEPTEQEWEVNRRGDFIQAKAALVALSNGELDLNWLDAEYWQHMHAITVVIASSDVYREFDDDKS